MRKRSMRRTLGAGLLGTLLAAACAGPKMIKLADGSKVQAAESYLSPEAMKARGKNAFGVPEASFVFYPKDYSPSGKNLFGQSRSDWDAFIRAAKNEGRDIPCQNFKPADEPQWDKRACDPPGTRYDCFDVERLFVIPWGNGQGKVGIRLGAGVTGPSDAMSHYEPIVWPTGGIGSDLYVYDIANNAAYLFRWNGECIGSIPERDKPTIQCYGFSEIRNLDIGESYLDVWNGPVGAHTIRPADCTVYFPSSFVTLPPRPEEQEQDEMGRIPRPGGISSAGLTDCMGATIAVPTMAGVEIYCYRLKG